MLGADEATGLHLIEACSGDVEMAVGMHLDAVGTAAPVNNVEQNANQDPLTARRSSESSSEVYVALVRLLTGNILRILP